MKHQAVWQGAFFMFPRRWVEYGRRGQLNTCSKQGGSKGSRLERRKAFGRGQTREKNSFSKPESYCFIILLNIEGKLAFHIAV